LCLFNSSFQIMWKSIICFMFFCWNLTMHLPFQEKFMIPLHLLKSMVNMNMKWRTFYIQESLIVNSNILFISMGMMWMTALGNQSRTYQMPWRRCMNFIDDTQINPSTPLVKFVTRKEVMSQMPMPWNSIIWMFIHDL
jgi:hypothetical protein